MKKKFLITARRLLFLAFTLALTVSLHAKEPAVSSPETLTYPANCSFVAVPPFAETNLIEITLDHADWTYSLGSNATFKINLAISPYPEAGVPITYRLGPEQFEGAEQSAVVPADGLVISAGTRNEPSFTRIIVKLNRDGKTTSALCTAGFAPGLIRPTQNEPADFDLFWEKQKAELAKIPAEPVLTPMPELSTTNVEVFQWSAQNVGNWEGNSRMYGILCVPRGPGPFPALLQVPGAGVRNYKGQIGLASEGVITLEIGIHGMPVNLVPEVYAALARAGLNNYQFTYLDDRNNFFYRRVYLGCLRANDYLTSHPKWDGKNLMVSGYSQGGMLSIVTTALDSRVTSLAVAYPAFCDVTGYLHGRAGGWPGIFRPGADGKIQTLAPDEPRLVTTAYYDTVNFAKRVKVPGFYSFGYNDNVCPPTSMLAAYNIITAPKELVISPEQAHQISAAQLKQRSDWVDTILGTKAIPLK